MTTEPVFPRAERRPAKFGGKSARDLALAFAVRWVKKRILQIEDEARAAGGESPLTQTAAQLYVLAATEVRDQRFDTPRLNRRRLTRLMRVEGNALRLAIKILEKVLGDVRVVDGGQGKKDVRFEFLRMAGPLYVENGGAAAASSIPRIEGDSIPRIEVEGQTRSVGSSSSTRDYVPLDQEEVQEEAVEQLVGRFSAAYEDRKRAKYTPDHDELAVVRRLLAEGRTADRILAMAENMWARRAAHLAIPCRSGPGGRACDDCFLARATKQGFRLLAHKRNELDAAVADVEVARTEEEQLWTRVCGRVEVLVSRDHFVRYIAPCRLEAAPVRDGVVHLWARSAEDREMLRTFQLEEPLRNALCEILGGEYALHFGWPSGGAEAAAG